MSENMFCEGMKTASHEYQDGWYRSFKGYPEVNDEVWEMIKSFREDPKKLLLFFFEYVTNDGEYANFLTREVMNGEWTR